MDELLTGGITDHNNVNGGDGGDGGTNRGTNGGSNGDSDIAEIEPPKPEKMAETILMLHLLVFHLDTYMMRNHHHQQIWFCMPRHI